MRSHAKTLLRWLGGWLLARLSSFTLKCLVAWWFAKEKLKRGNDAGTPP